MYRYDWDERMVGLSLGAIGLLVALVQGGLVRFVNPRIGNGKSILLGFAFQAVGLTLIGLAVQDWMIFLFLILHFPNLLPNQDFHTIFYIHHPYDADTT